MINPRLALHSNKLYLARIWNHTQHIPSLPVDGISIEAIQSLDGFRVSLGQRQGVRWSFDWRHLHTAANIHQDLETWGSLSPPSLCRDWSYCHADLSRKHGQLSWRGSDNTTYLPWGRGRPGAEQPWLLSYTREMLTSQAPQHDWARDQARDRCTKPWTLLVRVTSRVGRTKAHVTVLCAIIGLFCLSQLLIGLARK